MEVLDEAIAGTEHGLPSMEVLDEAIAGTEHGSLHQLDWSRLQHGVKRTLPQRR